jgi:hypothetical protein
MRHPGAWRGPGTDPWPTAAVKVVEEAVGQPIGEILAREPNNRALVAELTTLGLALNLTTIARWRKRHAAAIAYPEAR